MDQAYIEYQISEIQKQKEYPYFISNELLANELFSNVKESCPEAKLIKYSFMQWIVCSKSAQEVMLRQLRATITRHRQIIRDLEKTIIEMNCKEEL